MNDLQTCPNRLIQLGISIKIAITTLNLRARLLLLFLLLLDFLFLAVVSAQAFLDDFADDPVNNTLRDRLDGVDGGLRPERNVAATGPADVVVDLSQRGLQES